MDLKEKIEKQLEAGFESDEIYASLLKDGHSKEEIDREFKPAAVAHKRSNQVSGTSIFFGILFLVIVIFRIIRLGNSSGNNETGTILAVIGIFTGLGLMIYFLHRKEDKHGILFSASAWRKHTIG